MHDVPVYVPARGSIWAAGHHGQLGSLHVQLLFVGHSVDNLLMLSGQPHLVSARILCLICRLYFHLRWLARGMATTWPNSFSMSALRQAARLPALQGRPVAAAAGRVGGAVLGDAGGPQRGAARQRAGGGGTHPPHLPGDLPSRAERPESLQVDTLHVADSACRIPFCSLPSP